MESIHERNVGQSVLKLRNKCILKLSLSLSGENYFVPSYKHSALKRQNSFKMQYVKANYHINLKDSEPNNQQRGLIMHFYSKQTTNRNNESINKLCNKQSTETIFGWQLQSVAVDYIQSLTRCHCIYLSQNVKWISIVSFILFLCKSYFIIQFFLLTL